MMSFSDYKIPAFDIRIHSRSPSPSTSSSSSPSPSPTFRSFPGPAIAPPLASMSPERLPPMYITQRLSELSQKRDDAQALISLAQEQRFTQIQLGDLKALIHERVLPLLNIVVEGKPFRNQVNFLAQRETERLMKETTEPQRGKIPREDLFKEQELTILKVQAVCEKLEVCLTNQSSLAGTLAKMQKQLDRFETLLAKPRKPRKRQNEDGQSEPAKRGIGKRKKKEPSEAPLTHQTPPSLPMIPFFELPSLDHLETQLAGECRDGSSLVLDSYFDYADPNLAQLQKDL